VFVPHQVLVTGRTLDGWVALEEDSMARVTDHERGDDTDIQAAPEAAYCKAMSCELNLVGYV
jgi:hypothetical protein